MRWKDMVPEEVVARSVDDRFHDLSPAIVGDAMDRLSVMDGSIKYRGGRLPLVGRAFTVDLHPGDNLWLHRALHLAPKKAVLVVSTHGEATCGIWGEMMTREAVARGLSGVVIDGAVRDVGYLRAQSLAVFSRCVGASGAWKAAGGRLGWPVACGGVAVVPAETADEVLEEALKRQRQEGAFKVEMDGGTSLYHLLHIDRAT